MQPLEVPTGESGEVPWEFVTVIVADTIGFVLAPPLTVTFNGMVSMNWPPNWFEGEVLYQAWNGAESLITGTVEEARLVPLVGVSVKRALAMSSVLE